MIDNKGKLFGKINIVDLFVILIIIVAAIFTYFKFNVSKHSDITTSNGKAQFTIRVKDVRDFTANNFEVGHKVYDHESGKCIGVIKKVEVSDAYDYITKTDGTIAYSKRPERYNVELLIETDAVVNEKGINAGGTRTLYYNQKSVIYTKFVQTEGTVVELGLVE